MTAGTPTASLETALGRGAGAGSMRSDGPASPPCSWRPATAVPRPAGRRSCGPTPRVGRRARPGHRPRRRAGADLARCGTASPAGCPGPHHRTGASPPPGPCGPRGLRRRGPGRRGRPEPGSPWTEVIELHTRAGAGGGLAGLRPRIRLSHRAGSGAARGSALHPADLGARRFGGDRRTLLRGLSLGLPGRLAAARPLRR